jgi:hypothetical protein
MQRSSAFALFLLLSLFCSVSIAQVTSPAARSAADRQRDRVEADLQRRMTDMRALDQKMRPPARQLPTVSIPGEVRLTTEERHRILKARNVSPIDLAKYSNFLKQERTGIFKLFPDLGCHSQKVISIESGCEKSVPLSSWFNFRAVSYGDEVYHDIFFKSDRISSNGFFSQAIFSVVGDEQIENVSLTHPALKYLNTFQSDTDPRLAGEHALRLRQGIEFDGHSYSDNVVPQKDVTYALRLIAYRLENNIKPLSATSTMTEMMFLSLSVDKRLDMIVAFRVLGQDEYGGLTIVWKELSRNDAPKMKFAKSQPLRDFKPADE